MNLYLRRYLQIDLANYIYSNNIKNQVQYKIKLT